MKSTESTEDVVFETLTTGSKRKVLAKTDNAELVELVVRASVYGKDLESVTNVVRQTLKETSDKVLQEFPNATYSHATQRELIAEENVDTSGWYGRGVCTVLVLTLT